VTDAQRTAIAIMLLHTIDTPIRNICDLRVSMSASGFFDHAVRCAIASVGKALVEKEVSDYLNVWRA